MTLPATLAAASAKPVCVKDQTRPYAWLHSLSKVWPDKQEIKLSKKFKDFKKLGGLLIFSLHFDITLMLSPLHVYYRQSVLTRAALMSSC